MFALASFAVALSVSAQSVVAADASSAAGLDPRLPYQAVRSNPVTYDVDFSVVVTPPYKAKKLKVWIPMPTSDVGQEVSNSRLSSFPIAVEPQINAESVYGNRFAYFEFDAPQGGQIVRHQFRIKVWQLNWNVDGSKVSRQAVWPSGFDPYRIGDSQSVLVDGRFEKLVKEIVPANATPVQGFDDVLQWAQNNFAYDHNAASLRASSEHALTNRRGHCSDYHGFCASMGRVLGVPTRVTYGINPFPKNSPSHCKLEAFLAPYGWVSFDVSETQKLVGEIKKASDLSEAMKKQLIERAEARLMSGFRDNTWYLQTRGTDYDLVPKASKRVPVVRTAYIEADGIVLPDPDPADKGRVQFSWQTVQEFRPDRVVPYPFTDWKTLEGK